MKARHQRFLFIVFGLVVLGLATTLILNAFKGNLSYFFSPTEVADGKAPPDRLFRLGGMVQAGSVERAEGELTVRFVVTDHHQSMPVTYTGILPDLFAEGQGVIAQGRLNGQQEFVAEEVLAKHDENYMPPEVAAALSEGEKARMMQGALQ